MKQFRLTEYKTASIPKEELPSDIGEHLWRSYPNVLSVEPPTFKTNYCWHLTSLGWIGHIPLLDGGGIYLRPKIQLSNLFRMWEYAYRLNQFVFLKGMTICSSVADFYDNLAGILSGRVLDRARKGFYRTYLSESDSLPFIRGRIDTGRAMLRPWEVSIFCHFEEHTGDIEDNRILAWTLRKIARSGICREEIRGRIRAAYRALRSFTDVQAFTGKECVHRLYNRLNSDYLPLHALCRFFLESSGPAHETGDHDMIPFLVYMPALFELFVAEWLKSHLPTRYSLKSQYRLRIDEAGFFTFIPDLVIHDEQIGRACCVLDTKYKVPKKPGSDDIAKIATYALGLGCMEAVLIYPSPLPVGIDENIGSVHVHSTYFGLVGDLEEQGRRFIAEILKLIDT